MWALLDRRAQLTIVLGLGFCLAWSLEGGYRYLAGETLSTLRLLPIAVFLIGTALAAAANATWKPLWRKFPILQRVTFPDLSGTWEGSLVSTWIDPATGSPKPPIPTTITIRQTLFTISVTLQTGESKSHSTRAFLEAFPDRAAFRIWYSYNNDPQAQYQHRSSPHEGVAFLEIDIDAVPARLAGRYYTARRTTGDIDVRRIKRSRR